MESTRNVTAMATLRRPAPPVPSSTSGSSSSTLNAMLDKSSTSSSPSSQPPVPPSAAKPRIARPAKPLPPAPLAAAEPSATAAEPAATPSSPSNPSTPRKQEPEQKPDQPLAAAADASSPSPVPPPGEPNVDAAATSVAATSVESSSPVAAGAASSPAAARPGVPARPPTLATKKPPVPARRPGSQTVPTSPVPQRADAANSTFAPSALSSSSSCSSFAPVGSESETSSSSSSLSTTSSSAISGRASPSLRLTPSSPSSSPSSSGDRVPTSAAAGISHQSPANSPRGSTTTSSQADPLPSPRRTPGSGSGSGIGSGGTSFMPGLGSGISGSSLLSVFTSSSSSTSTIVDELEKRLRKVKEKREKLAKELKRLDEEECELEEKLKEARARDKEDKEDGSRGKRGSRRGSQIVRGSADPANNSGASGASSPSLGSASSLTLSPPSGTTGSGIASPLASGGSGIGGGNLHRRMGSLVGMAKGGPKKMKKSSSLTAFGDKGADAGPSGSPLAGSPAIEHDLNAPRQFYCKRAGSVTFKVEKSCDVAAAPPIKKYAREVRRKKTMLYIDSTSIQVMVPEEKTAKYPMSVIKNVGYSVKQFFMVVVKSRRRNAELLEFKTKEGQEIFDWVVALKNEEKRQREKEISDADADRAAETQSVVASQQQSNGAEGQKTGPADAEDTTSEPQQTGDAPASEAAPASPSTLPEGASQQPPSAMDRNDLVRWSVAFIAPISLDADAPGQDADDAEEDDEDAEEESGSCRGEPEGDGTDVAISSPQTIPKSPVPHKKLDIHRETLLELLATERNYNTDLDLIVEVWMAKLKESRMVEPADMSAIFSNIEQIRNLNKVLFNSLEGLDALPMESLNVGERFKTFIAYLKLYTQYCSNYDIAHTRLTSLKEAKWELPPFLESIQSRKECKNLDLESYLIKPMQRLTKYPLLIQARLARMARTHAECASLMCVFCAEQALLKHTPPTHPDHENLARCYDDVQKVVLTVNENKRKNENLTKLVQVQQQFLEPGLKLVEATRKFLREGTFPRVVLGNTVIKNCTVLLFNDMVVLAVKKKNKYQAKSGKITLRGSYVWEDRAVKNGFTLVGREAADKITVEAATEQEKTLWMDEVSQALVQLPHNSLLGGSSSPATAEKFVRQSEGIKE